MPIGFDRARNQRKISNRRKEGRGSRRRRARSDCLLTPLEERVLLSVAGGWTGSGITGSYYTGQQSAANQTQSNLKFTRTDVRIDFTNNSLKPGGSSDPQFGAVASSDFSVLWQGSLIAKYSELYTFRYFADDTLTVAIAHHNQGDWNTFINQAAYTGAWANANAPFSFTAGQTYDLKVTFSQAGGPWAAQLHWLSTGSSAFAEEAIDPATPVGVNYEPAAQKFADVMQFNGGFMNAPFGSPVSTDSAGYPTQDFNVQLFYNGGEYGQNVQGTYTLQFDGQAQVTAGWGATLDFKVGGTDYGATLPKGAGYNGTTTTATVVMPDISGSGQMYMAFSQTQRNGGGAGVTNIHLWRPTTLGGSTVAPAGSLLTQAALAEAQPFTGLRMMDWTNTNSNTETNWSDRTPATALSWGVMPWETAVAAANESGKDLYINIPEAATNTYVTDLANLLKYGSDGVNPYTSAQTNPVWAPLNPNLSVYIEYSNEVWNWNGNYNNIIQTVAQNQSNNTADWQLFQSAGGWVNTGNNSVDVSLWALTRATDISNDFRAVFGDSVMPANASGTVNVDPRIRPLFEWQYGGGWNGGSDSSTTAMTNLGAHLPHAIDYYIWGGGGGWYADDTRSGFADAQFANPNFDSGTANWNFSSGAGIVTNGSGMGNPNVPTDVNPAAAAKSTTNAVYLQPGASVSQSVYFSGGYADITWYGTQTVPYDWAHELTVSIDGGSPLAISEGDIVQNQYIWYRSAGFNVSAGYHTVTFASTLPSGTAFLTNVGIQTVNGLFNETNTTYQQTNWDQGSGINITHDIQADVAITSQFGLHHVGYEGGFDFNQNLSQWHNTSDYQSLGARGYSSGTPNVGMYANLDSRAEQLAITTLNEYFAAGGGVPFIFQSDGNNNSWGVIVPSLYNAVGAATSIPKIEAVATVQQSLPAGSGGVTAPAAPSGLSATAASTSQINLAWTDNATNETGYVVERATNSSFTQNDTTVNLGSNATSYGDSGLSTNTTYYYRVYATNSAGNSGYSNTANATTQNTPVGPTGYTYVVDENQSHTFSQTVDVAYGANGSFYYEYGVTGTITFNNATFGDPIPGTFKHGFYRLASGLPTGWNDADIGSPGVAGSASYNGTTWTVSGSGADIWGGSDQFNFASETWSGNGQIVARVASVQNTDGWAKAGVIFRDSTAANAMYAAVEITPGNGVAFQWRSSTGGNANDAHNTGVTAPQWVKLVRSGNSFSAYYSSDGSNWTQVGTTQTIAMATAAQAGLEVSAHNNALLCTSTFDNVSVGAAATYGTVADFELAGTAYNATAASPTSAASGFSVGNLTLGSGLQQNTQTYFVDGLMAQAAGWNYAADLATSIADNQFETFTITPQSGHSMALSSILLQSYFQNFPSTRGIGLRYSTDGTNFTTVGSVTGSAADSHTFDLSSISALQNVTSAVTFRIYVFGGQAYTTVGVGGQSGDDIVVSGYMT